MFIRYSFFPIFLFLCVASPAFAAEFNPNFLISDEEMQQANSMTRTDIQAFLEEKGGYLARLRIEDYLGKERSAADIIYRAAQEYSINPKYLLVKLQKEQSLITNTNPTEKQIDWATGYGVCDACKTTDPTIQKHKGFGTQVDSAAGIIRWYYDNLSTQSWIKREGETYQIDSTTVTPESDATGFLYTYTPHIHGNKNFWILWQEWFDQVYTNGSLLKSAEDSTVYLIEDGKRRAFKNMGALITRFDPTRIITVPDSEITRYEEGSPISFPNYAILRLRDTYYLLDYDTLQPFQNEATVRSLGFHPDEIIDISNEDIEGFSISKSTITNNTLSPAGKLIKAKETGAVYYLKDNLFHSLPDAAIAKTNFPQLSIESSSISVLGEYEQGDSILFKDGTLIGIQGFNKVYIIENGKKRHIADEEVFLGLGYSWDHIVWTNEIVGGQFPNGEPIYLRKSNTSSTTPSRPDTQQTKEDISSEQTPVSQDPNNFLVRTPKDKQTLLGDTDLLPNVEAYLIAEYTTGEILEGKNIEYPRPLASLTKVMTAYELLKQGVKLDGTTTYNSAIHTALYNQFRTVNGERFVNRDLMKALLVSSLNPPAKMLVSSVTKEETTFVKQMNEQAKSWGLTNTTFVDPAGVEVENKTTPKDYLTIFRQSLKNATIQEYLGMKEYTYDEVIDKDGKPTHFDTHSNALTQKSGLPFTIIASKTGYLYESGACLAMLIERKSDGKRFVIITMGNSEYANRFVAPEKLATYAVEQL